MLEDNQDDISILNMLGDTFLASGDDSSAIIQFRRVLELQPNDGHAKYVLSEIGSQKAVWAGSYIDDTVTSGLEPRRC